MRNEKSLWEKANAVEWQTRKRIRALENTENEAERRAALARLRRGVGRKPGDVPGIWAVLLEDLPRDMMGTGELHHPSCEEWAIYTAMTLYALHQRGSGEQGSMHCEGVSLGQAACALAKAQGDKKDNIIRRFNLVATAADMEEMNVYLRSFVQLLRGAGIGLDYAMLAKDLFRYQFQELAPDVRLKWGQDFYAGFQMTEDQTKNEEENDHA